MKGCLIAPIRKAWGSGLERIELGKLLPMKRPDIESHVIRTICRNYFGGDGKSDCADCMTQEECSEILNETFCYIEHISKDHKNVA